VREKTYQETNQIAKAIGTEVGFPNRKLKRVILRQLKTLKRKILFNHNLRLQISNLKRQTWKHMPTTLHKAPGHGWKHYFFEFLMLFLAITLGFLAENQREHYAERQRENQFAQLLFADLRKDAQDMDTIVSIKQWRARKIDSLFYFLSLPDLQGNSKPIYYYRAYLDINVAFNPNDATLQQLRSSGSLRYFRNLKLYNAITKYYSDCSRYLEQSEPGSTFTVSTVAGPTVRIFDADELYSIKSITPSIWDAVRYPAKEMQLITADKLVINEFKHYADLMQLSNNLSLALLGGIRQELDTLISDLKKEYHIR
jgi:hypothetical protein